MDFTLQDRVASPPTSTVVFAGPTSVTIAWALWGSSTSRVKFTVFSPIRFLALQV